MGGILILNLRLERLSRSIWTAFRLWLECRKNILFIFVDFFRFLSATKKSWTWCGISYLGISVGAAISLTLTALRFWLEFWQTIFQLVFYFFPTIVFSLENSVGGMLILNLVRERLSRSILSAFRFRRVSEIHFFTFFRLFQIFYLEISVEYFILNSKVWNFSIVCLDICVGRPFILDLVWERLFRSFLAALRFWLEYWQTIFQNVFYLFSDYCFLSWKQCRWNVDIEFSARAAISLNFVCFSIPSSFGNPFFWHFFDFSRFFILKLV